MQFGSKKSPVCNRPQSATRICESVASGSAGALKAYGLAWAEACGLACGPTVSGLNKAMGAVAHGRPGSDKLGVLNFINSRE